MELKSWAGRGLAQALWRDDDLGDFLRPGAGDLRRAHALLDLLDAEAEGFVVEFELAPDAAGSADHPLRALPERAFLPMWELEALPPHFEELAGRHLRTPARGDERALLERLILRFPRYGLAVRAEDLVRFLRPGLPGDLRRAHLLLDYLEPKGPDLLYAQFETTPDSAGAIQAEPAPHPLSALPAQLQQIVARHLLRSSGETWRSLQLLLQRLPAQGVFVGVEGLGEWRDHLRAASGDPGRLVRLCVRLCEAGFLPLELRERLRALAAREALALPTAPRSPGEWLAACLLESLSPPPALDRVEAAWRGLQESLRPLGLFSPHLFALGSPSRGEPLGDLSALAHEGPQGSSPGPDADVLELPEAFRRQRVAGAILVAEARLRAGLTLDLEWLRSAAAGPFLPDPRQDPALLALIARAATSSTALEAAARRVELLEAHASRLARGLPAEERLAWELSGWPMDRERLDPLRADALIDLAERRTRLEPKLALQRVDQALAISPQHARGLFRRAQLLAASGDEAGARREASRALRLAAPRESELRKSIRAFLTEIGPN